MRGMDKPKNYTDIHNLLQRSQTLVSWEAPLRPFKSNKKYLLRFFLALALILSLIVLFISDIILIIPIWAVLFLFYVLAITPPPTVENKVTKFGLETAGVRLRWDALSHFYFMNRFGFEVLTVVTDPPYNLHVYMVLPDSTTKEKVAYILGEKITFMERPPKSITDRLIDLFSILVPEDEEDDHAVTQKKTEATDQRPAPLSPEHQRSAPIS